MRTGTTETSSTRWTQYGAIWLKATISPSKSPRSSLQARWQDLTETSPTGCRLEDPARSGVDESAP